jgi:hypothetical protein
MLFSIDVPQDAVKNKAPKTTKTLSTKVRRDKARVRDLLAWTTSKKIAPYERNRGARTGRPVVAAPTVKSVRTKFNPWASAGIIACQVNDDMRARYPSLDKDSMLIIADGHGGLMGCWLRYCDGKMSEVELNADLPFTVAPAEEFLRIYTLRNTQSAQTVAQTLGSPDLLYGAVIWKKLMPLLSEFAVEMIAAKPSKFLPQISYHIESWKFRGTENWDYVQVFRSRTDVKDKRTLEAGKVDLGLKNADYQELAKAIDWYANFLSLFEEMVGEGVATSQVKSIQGSGPLFGLFVVDYLSEEPLIIPKNRSAKVLARQAANKVADLPEMAKSVVHGSDVNMRKAIHNISKLLNSQKK